MKRNFYLQHPIMAMHDPRMQNLVEKENLRGTGAYWFIIEKLAMLPEPRAQLKYLQPFCKSKKIPFCFLKKVILEYRLFIMDKDGYFTPAELNPVTKKEIKSADFDAESASFGTETADFEQKTAANRPKMARNRAGKKQKKPDNQLEYNDLQKSIDEHNKENIKDNITTTAATEEKEETAADDAVLQHPILPLRPWREMADDLTHESSWLDIACMQSGYGLLLKQHIREAVKIFKQHIEAYDKGDSLLEMSEVRRYFVNYVRAGSRTSRTLHEALHALDAKQQATAPPDPYRYEQLVDGKRTYLGCPIPDDAPPRPDNTAFWNEETHSWASQQQSPSSKKPKQRPG